MKKVVLLLLVFVVGLLMVSPARANVLDDKQAELARVKAYITTLDQKINQARAAKQINKIAALNDEKRKSLDRAKSLQDDIAAIEKAGGVERGWLATGGYGGGAGLLKIGYVFPVRNFNLVVDAGGAVGNNFTIAVADIQGIFPLGGNRLGVEVTAANYSKAVTNVPGISGNVDQGTHIGGGIFIGVPVRGIPIQIGYNTALGLNVTAVYKF